MKVFKRYAPKQIAKYVLAFFKGTFVIEGEGVFEFDSGKVKITVKMDENAKRICREINDVANQLTCVRMQPVSYK